MERVTTIRRFRRSAVAVVAAGAAALTTLVAPGAAADDGAHAEAVFPVYVEVLITHSFVEYGDKFGLEGHASYVRNGVGAPAPSSTWWVDRQFAGQTEWDRLREDGDTNPSEVGNLNARGNATYKMTYVQNTNGVDTWQYGTDTIYQWVSRAMNDGVYREKGDVWLDGRVEPDYERRKVILERRACWTCASKEVRRFETDHRSRYEVKLPRPKQGKGPFYYRAYIPDSTRFAGSYTDYYEVKAK